MGAISIVRFHVCCMIIWSTWLMMSKGNKVVLEVRLVDGKTPHDGRVEVRDYGTKWKYTLCAFEWDLREAHVVCRMLNYPKALAAGTVKVRYPSTVSGLIVFCDGDETQIYDCSKHYSSTICSHHNLGGTVTCGNLTAEEKAIQVRLVGNGVKHVGRVEIQYNGTWGAVCSNHFYKQDADVICRMLGYKAAERTFGRVEGDPKKTKIILANVECGGKEKSIAECYHNGWWNTTGSSYVGIKCSHKRLAGVVCQPNKEPPPIQIRLMEGSSPESGRIEVYYYGTWIKVCDAKVAEVFCHMLGYPGIHFDKKINKYNASAAKKEFWLQHNGCSGAEMSISNCSGRWTWENFYWCSKQVFRCTTAPQPLITVSETPNCTVKLTVNRTRNTAIENQLIKYYDIHVDTRKDRTVFSWMLVNESAASNVIVGDGNYYDGIYNTPLVPGSTYFVRVRAVSKAQNGIKRYGEINLVTFSINSTKCASQKRIKGASSQIQYSLLLCIVTIAPIYLVTV